MKTKIYVLIMLLGLFSASPVMAQKKGKRMKNVEVSKKDKKVPTVDLSAKVVDEQGNGLPGVVVTANEGASQTITDGEGNFNLKLKKGSILSFDYLGYKKTTLYDRDITSASNVVVLAENELSGVYTDVVLPYQIKQQFKTSGAVTVVNADEELDRDYRSNIGAAIGGKIPGATGLGSIHGLGSGAITVVDGIIRDVSYLTLQEVESMTVLKDAVSRMLYGAEGDQGVVLITTKRGESNKKTLKFDAEFGLQKAIAYPKYLDAASYMETYNQAAINDGGTAKYADDVIKNTRNRIDPVLYPDNNYYSDLWLKDVTNFSNIYGEASGGNEKVRYFMNLGWKRNKGWLKNAESDVQNVMNVRGKVDFQVNSWLKMNTDASAIFDINKTANVDDFWTKASTTLPMTSPLLIPVDRISNMEELTGVHLIDGQYLMGGTSVYQNNLLGDLTQGGTVTRTDRYLQFKVGFDMDLNKITKGLTASGAANFEFHNIFSETIGNSYAVYEVTGVDDNGMLTVGKHGVDKITTSKTVNHENMEFSRDFSGYFSLNYARAFGDHDVTAVWMGYGRQSRSKDVFQEDRRLSTGLQADYMYKNTYLLEAGLLWQGSKKMNPDDRWGMAPSFGAAWILTNEEFMKDLSWLNYLKVRASYGIIQNDNWVNTYGNYQGYFLYEPIYQSSTVFTYANGSRKNNSILISSAGNVYGWQKRAEFTAGFDAYLFGNKTWIEASYFNSTTKDMLVELVNTTPATAGGLKNYGNYNSTRYQGVEIGIKHRQNWGKLNMQIGLNYMFTMSEVLKNEEPVYDSELDKHLSKIGTKHNAMFGQEALGLYGAEDFNPDGTLVEGLAKPSFGTVKPGDIKYLDYNKDGVINENDVHDLGIVSGNNHVVSLNLDLRYQNWQFFALLSGAFGGKGWLNTDYYWFKGTSAKYSEFALQAYNPENPNPDAACPRLSLGNSSNNYRNSSYWLYDRSYINLDAVQLAYNFDFRASSPLRKLKVYLRASNLLKIAKDKDVLELNVGKAPQNRLVSLGIVTSF